MGGECSSHYFTRRKQRSQSFTDIGRIEAQCSQNAIPREGCNGRARDLSHVTRHFLARPLETTTLEGRSKRSLNRYPRRVWRITNPSPTLSLGSWAIASC